MLPTPARHAPISVTQAELPRADSACVSARCCPYWIAITTYSGVLSPVSLRTHFLVKDWAVALVLCTGINDVLIATRKLILERAGHKVVTATGERELITACA